MYQGALRILPCVSIEGLGTRLLVILGVASGRSLVSALMLGARDVVELVLRTTQSDSDLDGAASVGFRLDRRGGLRDLVEGSGGPGNF